MGASRAKCFVAVICGLGWIAIKPAPALSEWACEPAGFPVAIDIGHYRARAGALSARGVPEFEFNLALAREVVAMLHAAGFNRSSLIGETGAPLELRERTGMATRGGARVLVSLHHDSVQPRYLRTWTLQGRVRSVRRSTATWSLQVSGWMAPEAGRLDRPPRNDPALAPNHRHAGIDGRKRGQRKVKGCRASSPGEPLMGWTSTGG